MMLRMPTMLHVSKLLSRGHGLAPVLLKRASPVVIWDE